MDRHDDAAVTHTVLAAHSPAAGQVTLHPGPGTSSDTALACDLLTALGKPSQLAGRFPGGRQPLWEAAAAWIHAMAITRLTVLRAHRLTERRLYRLLELRARTGCSLVLVCHRPRTPAALYQALLTVDHVYAEAAAVLQPSWQHRHPHLNTVPPPTAGAREAARWLTLPSLDRLVSYDSPTPCPGPCTPPPPAWDNRLQPTPLTPRAAALVTARIHASTAHPRHAGALAAAIITNASFQQLATARPLDLDETGTTLALHDRTRYTDGCATHPVPAWARSFLRTAARFAQLAASPDEPLLARPEDRPLLLRTAEAAKLRPPQPSAAGRTAPRGRAVWDWRETQEAARYKDLLASRIHGRHPST
ncbi:hypothetical protein [Streptomyces flavidovirens]|uniref:Uncharacterized protein n=1 Tax=Streptomyces flavidovirens TaxID=67298 RepID=A0ABW6RPT6_9ACTN